MFANPMRAIPHSAVREPRRTRQKRTKALGPGRFELKVLYTQRMLRARHAVRLVGELIMFARLNRAWWLLFVIPLLIVAVLAVGTTHAVVPYTVYTLF